MQTLEQVYAKILYSHLDFLLNRKISSLSIYIVYVMMTRKKEKIKYRVDPYLRPEHTLCLYMNHITRGQGLV